ncbi:MAG: hypothetical protein QME41_08670 [Actinomycetota bacterium]|nr:hypothetical protein [Actinomycetota bacterium]
MSARKLLGIFVALLIVFSAVPVSFASTQYSPPRARCYGFQYSNMDSRLAAKHGSDELDLVGYDSMYLYSNPAHYAYNNMYQNAIYAFTGHGYCDSAGGLGAAFYNTYTTAYPKDTFFRGGSGTNSSSTVWINNLSNSSFSEMLLAVNSGCMTASTHPTYGNFTKRMYEKGANTSIGFSQLVLDVYNMKWFETFFWYVRYGYSFGDASYNAYIDTKNAYDPQFGRSDGGGLWSVMLYGSSTAKGTPARYGN